MYVKIKIANPHFAFFKFPIFPSVTEGKIETLKYISTFFSVKDSSATTWLRILKFGTKLDSNELYCVTKTATYCTSVTLFVHFSWFLLEPMFSNFVYTFR